MFCSGNLFVCVLYFAHYHAVGRMLRTCNRNRNGECGHEVYPCHCKPNFINLFLQQILFGWQKAPGSNCSIFILRFVAEIDVVFLQNYVSSVVHVVVGGLGKHFSFLKIVKSLIKKIFFQTSGNTFYCVRIYC